MCYFAKIKIKQQFWPNGTKYLLKIKNYILFTFFVVRGWQKPFLCTHKAYECLGKTLQKQNKEQNKFTAFFINIKCAKGYKKKHLTFHSRKNGNTTFIIYFSQEME